MASKRPSAVHADWWEPDEQVMLRGVWPHGLETARMAVVTRHLQGELDLTGLSRDELNDYLQAHPATAIAIGQEAELELLRAMVLKEGTLLRYEPTAEQVAAGQPGDPVPFDQDWFADLSRRDWQFLLAEVQQRSDSIAVQAEEETRADDVPTASSSAASSSGTLADRPAAGSDRPPDVLVRTS